MSEFGIEDLPRPPLFKLVDKDGADVLQETAVGGETAAVGVLFAERQLAEEFSATAGEHGMGAFARCEPAELGDWDAVEVYAGSGAGYLLVISDRGTGLFHAGDVAHRAAEEAGEMPFPLYVLSDEGGEAPLITVETGGEESLVATLFSSPTKARAFRERAEHLDLPDRLGTIDDADGLRRHALVAQQTGAAYVVVDPESGLTDAIPIGDLIR